MGEESPLMLGPGPHQQFTHPCPVLGWLCRFHHTSCATLPWHLCCTLELPLDVSMAVICPPLLQIVLVVILFYTSDLGI